MDKQEQMILKVYGYKGIDNSQLSKKNVIESKKIISGLILPNTDKIRDLSVGPKNINKQSRKILNSLFPDLNREIRVITINDYYKYATKYKDGMITIEEYLESLKKHSFRTDAINAPITFVDGVHCTRADTVKPLALVNNDSYLSNLPIYVSGYRIGSMQLSRLGIITHLHEVTHSLLERNKGSVEDYYKSEMLSILMEKIAALEIDQTGVLLSKQNIYRYENLKQSINTVTENTHKYLLSTLLAEVLFDKYENGTDAYKHHILAQISKVLSGELVLEKMLINEGIVLDNSNLPCFIDEKVQKSIKNIK